MNLLIRKSQPEALVRDSYSPGKGEQVVPALPGLTVEEYSPKIIANLLPALESAVFRVKREATERIEELEWRIQRARERDSIGADGESEADVLREREAVRRASNRAEDYLAELENEKEIRSYAFDVLPSDYPPVTATTRLTFMRRFTDQERADIRAERDNGSNQDLLDFWELLTLASSVRLTDPDIVEGVNMLETNGLIAKGRADEVLAV
ncbi:hypothetical protein [Vreelandella jeotgali]|uniref:hypothetical protein n=1 Tax=Vreelandella jeotgali TaxID=553386 RepID=UPI0012EA2047|nr:hypothetical protein [Halomonas jeotgali]